MCQNPLIKTDETITVQWLGDIALTGQFVEPANHGVLARNVAFLAQKLLPCDLRIANWEAPIVRTEGVTSHKKVAICTDAHTACKARPLGLDAALVANNHIFDGLRPGFENTTSFLDESGIAWVGAGTTSDKATQPLVVERKDGESVILAYVDEDTHPQVPTNESLYLNMLEPERVLHDVRYWARDDRCVLVHFHCGMDFLSLPAPKHRTLARKALEAGATVVVCYHPHRLQGFERFGDGYIFYGLGNLLAGTIYPWPRFTEPTAVITCSMIGRRVIKMQIQYFILRNGILGPDKDGRGQKMFRKTNRLLLLDEQRYERAWSRRIAYDLAVTRPLHFIRRHKSPAKMLAALEVRQAAEYWALLRTMVGRSRR